MPHEPLGPIRRNDRDRVRAYEHFVKLYPVVEAALERQWAQLDTAEPPPDVLYHYTSARALLGILEQKKIYLSDSFFLNDQSELIYGRDLAVGRMRAAAERAQVGEVKSFFSETAENFDPFGDSQNNPEQQQRYYVACFCTQKNLLSQWRAYGHPGSGYALGLETQPLRAAENASADELRAVLHRIEYARPNQELLIDFVLDWCDERLTMDLASVDDPFSRKVLKSGYLALLIIKLAGLFAQFKHPVFEEEREWRLTASRLPYQYRDRLKFRDSGPFIVPYMLFDLAAAGGLVPVREIVHAPAAEPDLRQRSLRAFLDHLGYPRDLPVGGSDIPLRVS